MSDPLGIFRQPFSVPRPTQTAGLATLSKAVAVTISFPPWRAAPLFLLMSAVFTPAFVLPQPTQVAAIATLTKTVAVTPLAPPAFKAPSPLLTGAFAFVRPFELPRTSQNLAVIALSKVAPVAAVPFSGGAGLGMLDKTQTRWKRRQATWRARR